ncbi:MAG TPA: hypothetical protein IAB56_00285 [Candidatus Scybalousia intestinigallinarum]|nr:hypothetical protein [Candidatus Scybalousia intestinigallinarum]
MENTIDFKNLILSDNHLNLLFEKHLSKQLYEYNLLSFSTYEKLKEEIDQEILEIKQHFEKKLKSESLSFISPLNIRLFLNRKENFNDE